MTLDEILTVHRDGDLGAAEVAYREHLDGAPNDADALRLLGTLRQQRGDYAQALQLLKRAIVAAPDDAAAQLALGGVHMHLGNESDAREAFERALVLDPNLVAAHGLIGHMQLRDGDVESAEARFKIGRRAADDDPMLLFGLGSVYLARDDAANAAKFMARAAEQKPEDGAIQAGLGRALFEQGAYGLAEKALENALRLRPDLSVARLYLARASLRQSHLERARGRFVDLLENNQQHFGANAGLGDIARQQGHNVKALKYYRRALAMDPTHPGAILACAWGMEVLGDVEGAAQYLTEGIKLAPQAVQLRKPLALLLERLGRNTEADAVRIAGLNA